MKDDDRRKEESADLILWGGGTGSLGSYSSLAGLRSPLCYASSGITASISSPSGSPLIKYDLLLLGPEHHNLMSSSPDQLESGDSNDSLLHRRHSESSSRYVVESGIYMSSFAATIFVAALVTLGVALLTWLAALTVMLEACQNRNSGVVKQVGTGGQEYCDIFAFHAEINNLATEEVPVACKLHALQDLNKGRFLQEFNLTVQIAESYFDALLPHNDGFDVIFVDIDDTFLSDTNYSNNSLQDRSLQVENMKYLGSMLVIKLHMKLQTRGWSLIPFTRQHMENWNATINRIKSAGYGKWSSLIMRSDRELAMENWEFISARRMQFCKQGFRIASVISSQMDALVGPCLGKRNFKLAHSIHYKFEQNGIWDVTLKIPLL